MRHHDPAPSRHEPVDLVPTERRTAPGIARIATVPPQPLLSPPPLLPPLLSPALLPPLLPPALLPPPLAG